MASSPALQLPSTSVDLYGASVVTATRAASDNRRGVLYDNLVLAAGVPVHFHPISPTKFLVAFSRIWTAATPSATQLGFYSSYTESRVPSWFLADKTGWRGYVGSSPIIPVQTAIDSITLVDGCSRAPDYVYLLHSVEIGGVTQGLLQHFQMTVNGRMIPIAEELVPNLAGQGVSFDKGIAYTTPNLTVFGTDEDGNVFQVRKPWRAVGSSSYTSAQSGTTVTPWEYSTSTGWTTDPTQAAPEPGLNAAGPISQATWRKTTYLAITQTNGPAMSAQVFYEQPGQPWKKMGSPIALGSTADGSYLGGTLQLQSMLGPTPTMVGVPVSETAFPYCVATKSRVSSEDSLVVNWGLLQIPRQV